MSAFSTWFRYSCDTDAFGSVQTQHLGSIRSRIIKLFIDTFLLINLMIVLMTKIAAAPHTSVSKRGQEIKAAIIDGLSCPVLSQQLKPVQTAGSSMCLSIAEDSKNDRKSRKKMAPRNSNCSYLKCNLARCLEKFLCLLFHCLENHISIRTDAAFISNIHQVFPTNITALTWLHASFFRAIWL